MIAQIIPVIDEILCQTSYSNSDADQYEAQFIFASISTVKIFHMFAWANWFHNESKTGAVIFIDGFTAMITF